MVLKLMRGKSNSRGVQRWEWEGWWWQTRRAWPQVLAKVVTFVCRLSVQYIYANVSNLCKCWKWLEWEARQRNTCHTTGSSHQGRKGRHAEKHHLQEGRVHHLRLISLFFQELGMWLTNSSLNLSGLMNKQNINLETVGNPLVLGESFKILGWQACKWAFIGRK